MSKIISKFFISTVCASSFSLLFPTQSSSTTTQEKLLKNDSSWVENLTSKQIENDNGALVSQRSSSGSEGYLEYEGGGPATSESYLIDLRPTDWAYEGVVFMVQEVGVLVGLADGSYRGWRQVTPEQLSLTLNAFQAWLQRNGLSQCYSGLSRNNLNGQADASDLPSPSASDLSSASISREEYLRQFPRQLTTYELAYVLHNAYRNCR